MSDKHKHYLKKLVRRAEDVRPFMFSGIDMNSEMGHEAEAIIWATNEITRLQAQLDEARKNAGFYKCCAMCGETPTEGSEPYPPTNKGADT